MDKLTALIVEDDRDTTWFFKTVLDLGGFECENVFTAKDAFVKLTASVPDLILLDMRLGLEIAARISFINFAQTRASIKPA